MKKVIGQTVRDLKREVNKKVLKVPGIEQKVLDATSNEAWGPHGALLADLAQASRNFHELQMILTVIWKRINDTGKNWRHVYKALTVLEYLVAHGSERVIEEIREHAYQISTLSTFQYIDSSGRDQGSNIRRKSQNLVALVNDKERIQEVRQKANANRDKYQSTGPAGSTYKAGHDRYDDDNREGRYGYKDDDRNGNERERDDGYKSDDRYGRGRESYNRDGDRNGRDQEEHNGRDGYKNDDYGGRGTDDYQLGSRGSVDRYTERSADDDDRYSSKSGGGRGDGHSHDERRLEQHLSEENVGVPPSYEDATRNAQNHTLKERDGDAVVSPNDKSSSHTASKPNSSMEITSQSPNHTASSESPSIEIDAFDEFDPRGSVSAPPPSASSPELDFFGSLSASDSTNSLALIPGDTSNTTSKAAMQVNSDFGMDFAAPAATFNVSCETNENPFGDPPFKATPGDSFQAQHQNSTPVHSNQVSNGGMDSFPSNMGTVPGFDFGDMMGGLSFAPQTGNGQNYSATAAFPGSGMPVAPPSNDILDGILPRTDSANNISSQTTEHSAPRDSHFFEPGLPAMFPPQESAQPAGPNNAQPPHLNFFQQEVSLPTSLPLQTAPVSSQEAQDPIPNNTQSADLSFLQQEVTAPASLPPSSQEAQHASPNNMQLDHLSFLAQGVPAPPSLPSQEAPVSSQATQPAAASNMQSGQLSFFQQSGIPSSATPSPFPSAQPAAPNMQLDHFNNFQQPAFSVSAPFSSQSAQPPALSNIQSTQLNPQPQSGFSTQLAPQGVPTSFAPFAKAQPAAPNNMQLDHFNNFQQPAFSAPTPFSSQSAQPSAPGNIQSTQLNPQQQAGLSMQPAPQGAPTAFAPPAKAPPVKFAPKSTVWADTLNRGLVDLNISGPKTNPLSDIGVDFDSINRKEKRMEAKVSAAPVTSTITMGKAMGAGSGIGRAGATGVAPALNPMISSGMGMGRGGHMGMGAGMGMGGGGHMGMGGGANMGMGMGGYGGGMNPPPMGMMGGYGGGGMNQPASMGMNMGGYGGGTNQPYMGMNMGMGPTGMTPAAPGISGFGYNPMAGMNNYNPQQQQQQQNGGAPQQQPFGGGYR